MIPIRVTDMQVVLVERPHPRFEDAWVTYSFDNPTGLTTSNYFSTPLIEVPYGLRPLRTIICSNESGGFNTSLDGGVCVFWGVGADGETNVSNIRWRALTPTNTGKNELGIRSFVTGIISFFSSTTSIVHTVPSYLHDFLIPPVEVPEGSSLFFMLFHPLALFWDRGFHLTIIVRREVPS